MGRKARLVKRILRLGTAITALGVIGTYPGAAQSKIITQIIDSTGDGGGNTLSSPGGIAVDGSGNVYVIGRDSDNAFQIDPKGVITEIIDSTGDGAGNTLDNPFGVAVDGSGNVYVTGALSNNAFQIDPNGVITEIIELTGDPTGTFFGVAGIAVDGLGNAEGLKPGPAAPHPFRAV